MKIQRLSRLLLVAALLGAPAVTLAEKGGKHDRGRDKEAVERRDERRGSDDISIEFHFGDRDRDIVQQYYGEPSGSRRCPPGLAKKGNGCMPPGQVKKWARGRPLPRDIALYELPRDLHYRLPPPPSGHRYVRIGADILLIAIGSAMVVDAIEDIVR